MNNSVSTGSDVRTFGKFAYKQQFAAACKEMGMHTDEKLLPDFMDVYPTTEANFTSALELREAMKEYLAEVPAPAKVVIPSTPETTQVDRTASQVSDTAVYLPWLDEATFKAVTIADYVSACENATKNTFGLPKRAGRNYDGPTLSELSAIAKFNDLHTVGDLEGSDVYEAMRKRLTSASAGATDKTGLVKFLNESGTINHAIAKSGLVRANGHCKVVLYLTPDNRVMWFETERERREFAKLNK